jgi:hypothetical protein
MLEQGIKLFGFELKKAQTPKEQKSVVPQRDEDGSGYTIVGSAGHYGQYVDIHGDQSKDNTEQILKYRGIAMNPEVDTAIEEIVNESITYTSEANMVELNLEKLEKVSDSVKKRIKEEFDTVLSLCNFNEDASDIFKRWYVDGRFFQHIIVDPNNTSAGIDELRYIDAAKMRKMKEIIYSTEPRTGIKVIDKINEFFIFQEKPGNTVQGVKFTKDSINYVTSGLLDEERKSIISHIHKAIKPANQLRMMEDSMVIYRLSRAPERRMFYIDVGNLPKAKAEEYMKNIQAKYRNKLVYDAETGQIKDDRKHMTMLEDFWLPRREGGRGTEISTLPGGQNLGDIEDIVYFQKGLYKALNVPLNRLEQESPFSMGRSNEVSREEIKFQKFIDRLRVRFSYILLNPLKIQLMLKGVITEEDWNEWKTKIKIDFAQDNAFAELKEVEIVRERLQTLSLIENYIIGNSDINGGYFTDEYVMQKILRMTEEDIEEVQKERELKEKEGEEGEEDEDGGNMDSGMPPEAQTFSIQPVAAEPAPKPEPKVEPKPEPKPVPKVEPKEKDKKDEKKS